MPIQVQNIVARHRADDQPRPFEVVLNAWQFATVCGSLIILTATSLYAVVAR